MPDSHPKTVLYIEDDPAYILLMRRAFQRSKLDNLPYLRAMMTAEEAIAYLEGQEPYGDRSAYPLPALVLTDLRLPGRSGLQLLRWIRAQSTLTDLPVVMLTGSALDEDIKVAYDYGVNFCLVKPAEVEMLISLIQALSVYWVPPPKQVTR